MVAYQNPNCNIHLTTSDKKANVQRWKIETLQQSPLPKQTKITVHNVHGAKIF